MTLRFTEDATAAIARAAESEGTSRSEIIRRIVTEHLKAKGYLPTGRADG